MRALRVFHLIKGLGRGGAEMLLTDGPLASDPGRFTYGFGYFLPHKDALVATLKANQSDVECFSAKTPLEMTGRILDVARHLRHWRADVLHCHLPLAGVAGRLAGRLAGVPVVYTEHNLIERYHVATRAAARATWSLQRHVIAVSTEVATSVTAHFGLRVPVKVISNGVSVERFSPEASERARMRASLRADLGIERDARVVGSIAVFRKQKRLDYWLSVASATAAASPDVRFLLVGDGPLRQEVEARAKALQLGDRLLLPGLKADVRPYLAAMDAYLMTSDFEGLPIALLEAMASGLTAVATDAGGIPDVIEAGRSGFLLPRGDVKAVTNALQHVLDASPAERNAWGAAARARVQDHFSTSRMMREIEKVYEDVVARG